MCLIGMFKQRKRDTYLVFYTIITSLVLFVFNGLQGHRYLLPLFPFLLYFAYCQIGQNTITKGLLMSFITLMVLYNVYHVYLVRTHKISTDYSTAPLTMEMYDFVRSTVKDHEHVYFMKPRVLNLYTDVHAITGDEDTIEEVSNRVEYMILYRNRSDYNAFHSYCVNQSYPLLFENEWFEIYNVDR